MSRLPLMMEVGWTYQLLPTGEWLAERSDGEGKVMTRVFENGVWRDLNPSPCETGGSSHFNEYYLESVHIRLKLNGSEEKRELFDYIMGRLDLDYPFAPECLIRASEGHRKELPVCPTCGGKTWKRPIWGQDSLKRLAQQINDCKELPGGLGLKIKRWELETKCPVKSVSSADSDELERMGASC